jgi:hypothetical protein
MSDVQKRLAVLQAHLLAAPEHAADLLLMHLPGSVQSLRHALPSKSTVTHYVSNTQQFLRSFRWMDLVYLAPGGALYRVYKDIFLAPQDHHYSLPELYFLAAGHSLLLIYFICKKSILASAQHAACASLLIQKIRTHSNAILPASARNANVATQVDWQQLKLFVALSVPVLMSVLSRSIADDDFYGLLGSVLHAFPLGRRAVEQSLLQPMSRSSEAPGAEFRDVLTSVVNGAGFWDILLYRAALCGFVHSLSRSATNNVSK